MKTRTCLLLLLFVSLSQAAPLGTGFTYQGELKQLGANANGPFDFQFDCKDAIDHVDVSEDHRGCDGGPAIINVKQLELKVE